MGPELLQRYQFLLLHLLTVWLPVSLAGMVGTSCFYQIEMYRPSSHTGLCFCLMKNTASQPSALNITVSEDAEEQRDEDQLLELLRNNQNMKAGNSYLAGSDFKDRY